MNANQDLQVTEVHAKMVTEVIAERVLQEENLKITSNLLLI